MKILAFKGFMITVIVCGGSKKVDSGGRRLGFGAMGVAVANKARGVKLTLDEVLLEEWNIIENRTVIEGVSRNATHGTGFGSIKWRTALGISHSIDIGVNKGLEGWTIEMCRDFELWKRRECINKVNFARCSGELAFLFS